MFTFLQMFGSGVPEGMRPGKVNLKGLMRRFHEDEEGQGMTEYIIILVLIAIFVIIVVQIFGKKIKGLFKESTNALNEQVQASPTA